MNNEIDTMRGHRERIKKKLLTSSSDAMLDYELLELILCYSIPRKDVKPLAKKLIEEFKSISVIISSDSDTLRKFHNIGDSTIALFKIIKETVIRITKEETREKPILSSSSSLKKYLRASMANSSKELFRVLFLNKKNHLIRDDLMSEGTIDQVAVYPREIAKKAIIYEASAIIMVHNHPSGCANPSREDIELTKLTIASLIPLSIIVHDHIIITHKEYFSFQVNGLL